MSSYDPKLARALVLDELFDLTLYKKIHPFAHEKTKQVLDELIVIEEKHFTFWNDFFNVEIKKLNFLRNIKLSLLTLFCRITGETGIHLVLEAIEVFGIKKYLQVWEFYKNDPLGEAVKDVLEDEFKHEDEIVNSAIERKIHPERIRNIFFGLNDGLVEILGVISGFFAAFQTISAVLVAGFTVAVAGSISMAAGSYVAIGSEQEIEKLERQKKKFLKQDSEEKRGSPALGSAMVVGISYFIGAMVPVLPVLLGATTIVASVIAAGITIVIISYILAFLSGMDVKRRILINVVILAIAVTVTYVIGLTASNLFGVSI